MQLRDLQVTRYMIWGHYFMIVASHLLMSKFLYDSLQDAGLSLNYKQFRYGNIKPDLNGIFVRHSHRIVQSFDFVLNHMNKLIAMGYKPDSKKFSLCLGVICHYLTDFFTFPHNIHFTGTFLQHMKYEGNMQKYLSSLPENFQKTLLPFSPQDVNSLDDLVEHLLAMHEKYLANRTGDVQIDFSYSFYYCSFACKSLIHLSQQHHAAVPLPMLTQAHS